jgi:enterochelin esterase-like enzyme
MYEHGYPTLYVLHGYPLRESHWDELGLDELVEEGILEGRWAPFIIIMPRVPDPINTNTSGGPGSYEQEMLDGLLGYIETHYRTIPAAEKRALAGISRGGVWALEIGFRHADVFGTVGAVSPALHVSRAPPEYSPLDLAQNHEPLPEHIFLSVGDLEYGFRGKTEDVSRHLRERGIPHTFVLTQGGHEMATWAGIMELLVEFVTMGWEDP